MDSLKAEKAKAEQAAADTKAKKEKTEAEQKKKQEATLGEACGKALAGARLSLKDLSALLKWQGVPVQGKPTKEDGPALKEKWAACKVAAEVLRMHAKESAPVAKRAPVTAAKKGAKRKRAADSSDDDSDDEDDDEPDDEDEDGEAMEEDGGEDDKKDGEEEEEEEEDDDEDDEESWDVKCILSERKNGKKVEYQVEWEGDEWAGKPTWEPACNIPATNEALVAWLARKQAKGK